MTVTVCPRRPSVDESALTTSDRPPLVAKGCISAATITISSGAGSGARERGRGGFAATFEGRFGGCSTFPRGASADLAIFARSASVGLSAFALTGFGAFRGAALGDGWDSGAVGRFFAIYLSGTAACGQNLESNMPGRHLPPLVLPHRTGI